MIRLVFSSSACGPMTQERLLDILRDSRRDNVRDGLTGMLLYREGVFLQVLEGPAEAVDAALLRSFMNPHHTGEHVIERQAIGKRRFQDWRMSFECDRAVPPGVEGYSDFLLRERTAEDRRLFGDPTLALFRYF